MKTQGRNGEHNAGVLMEWVQQTHLSRPEGDKQCMFQAVGLACVRKRRVSVPGDERAKPWTVQDEVRKGKSWGFRHH